MLSARAQGFDVGEKAGGEVVTNADRAANVIIIAAVTAAFPSDVIFSEESPDPPGRRDARRVWIVDPMDGTSDFVRGGDSFTVSIGLSILGAAVLGVVCNPVQGRLYCGVVGDGVLVNESSTTVSTATEIATAHLVVCSLRPRATTTSHRSRSSRRCTSTSSTFDMRRSASTIPRG